MAKWIPVLVRLEDYPAVTALIAERESGRTDSEPFTPVSEVREVSKPMTHEDEQLAKHLPWTVTDLERLAEGKVITTERWSRALDVCAENPRKWMPTSEIARRTGLSVNEWRDATRKISRHLKAHFPSVPTDAEGNLEWPLAVGGNDILDNGGEVWWAITHEQATLWKEVKEQ